MTFNRRRAAIAFAPLVAAAVLVGCSAQPDGDGGTTDEAKEPIRIAFITPETGSLSLLGSDQRAALEFIVEEVNAAGGVDGRQVEFVSADSQGTAEGAVAAAQRLVRQENAPFIFGPTATPETLALTQQLKALDALLITAQSQGNALTGESCNPRFFRATFSDAMVNKGFELWAEGIPERSWETTGADYSFGRESSAEFAAAIEALGGTATNDVFPPLGTADFAPYLERLRPAEGLLVAIPGADAINFFKQGLQFGTFDDYDVVASNAGVNSTSIAAIGEGMTGFWGAVHWTETLDTPQNQAFVQKYYETTGEYPGSYVGTAYNALLMLFAGIEEAGTLDRAAVAKALEGLTFDALQGPLTVRAEDHQLLVPVIIGQVAEIDGRLQLGSDTVIPGEEASPEASAECTMGEP